MHNDLPKIYCFIDKFNKEHIKKLNKNIAIIYRNYDEKLDISLIKNINQFCKKNRRKFFLANNIKTAIKLSLHGVYIPSFNKKMDINYYTKKKNFFILGSAHNLAEIRNKEAQKVNCIFLSPLFFIPKSKKFLGIHKFNSLSYFTKKKIICLGGINKNNLKKTKLINTYGVASISLFKKKIKYI